MHCLYPVPFLLELVILDNFSIVKSMNTPERRQYLITGEVSLTDWELVFRLLGRIGIDTKPVDPADVMLGPTAAVIDSIEDGSIPYTLDEITSREQYLGNEHLGDFWPEYRRNVVNSGKRPDDKHECLCWGLNMLAQPSRKGTSAHMSAGQRAKYAEELGLKVITPRSLAGFSDKYRPGSYGLWDHKDYGASVIEVGSFIDYVRVLADLPFTERPFGVETPVIRYFTALADKLDAQISATELSSDS